ncbi:MucR family transcriptional regulator [Sphingomonas sp. DT-207]|uniref:MucR family transcriptional regulator n=1 Tax=Sphingomonas sp. DT-207 TaxID=3396167 RepID=UPI003F1A34DE
MADTDAKQMLVALTVDIVAAHVTNNNVPVSDMPSLIGQVHSALSALDTSSQEEPVKLRPAVSIRASVKPDYIICLEDGKKLKMLKRYLRTHFQMTPEQYRANQSNRALGPARRGCSPRGGGGCALSSGFRRKPDRRGGRLKRARRCLMNGAYRSHPPWRSI